MFWIHIPCLRNGKSAKNNKELHCTLDPYPLSLEKVYAVKNIFEKGISKSDNILESMAEYLFNFSVYHARWSEIGLNDIYIENKYEKGAESRVKVAIPNNMNNFDEIEEYKWEGNVNTPYLGMIINYCRENNIDLPHPANDTEIAYSKRTKTMCDEYNAPFINFLDMDIVNFDTDCSDEYSHLNPSGARKVTRFLGEYIRKNYGIPNQKENEIYDFWNIDYDEYIEYKICNLESKKDNLNEFLMLLYDEDDINYEIKVSSKFDLNINDVTAKLLNNLENNYTIDYGAFSEKPDKFFKIVVQSKVYWF